jgi:hypothetical protein
MRNRAPLCGGACSRKRTRTSGRCVSSLCECAISSRSARQNQHAAATRALSRSDTSKVRSRAGNWTRQCASSTSDSDSLASLKGLERPNGDRQLRRSRPQWPQRTSGVATLRWLEHDDGGPGGPPSPVRPQQGLRRWRPQTCRRNQSACTRVAFSVPDPDTKGPALSSNGSCGVAE